MTRSVLLVLVVLCSSSVARADVDHFGWSHWGGSGSGRCGTPCGVTLGLALSVDLAITIGDIVLLANQDHLSGGWAVVQGLWGGGHVLLGAILTGVGALGLALEVDGGGSLVMFGLLLVGEGLFFIIVAIVSAVRGFQELRKHALFDSPYLPSLAVAPTQHGGMGVLSWRF